jgi:type IV fimbrial biogenesis protein FimT
MMAVVAIAGVLLAVGAPAMADFLATQRVKSAAMDLRSALVLARSEAIKRNTNVAVAAKGGDLANGWEVKVGSTVLQSAGNPDAVGVSGSSVSTISYNREGRLANPGRITLLLSASSNPQVVPRCIVIDLNGRPSIQLDNNRDGNCTNG